MGVVKNLRDQTALTSAQFNHVGLPEFDGHIYNYQKAMGRKKKAFSAHFKPSNVGFRYGGSEGDEKKWQDAMAMNQKREIENDSSISEFLKSQMLLIESGLSRINDVMFIPTYMASDSAKEAVNHLKSLFRNQAPAEWEKKENLYRIGLSLSTLIILFIFSSDKMISCFFVPTSPTPPPTRPVLPPWGTTQMSCL